MTVDATDIVDDADEQTDRWREYVRPAAEWFHDHEGELFERDEAVNNLTDELDVSTSVAQETLANLVADVVDPVVQVPLNESKYVGVIEYHEFDGAYGYVHFDDNRGKERRVVCAQCVHNAEYDSEVTHATGGDPHGTFGEDADYKTLLNAVHDHYEVHDSKPEDVETGATLASGTTIGGNTAYHGGNVGTLPITDFGVGTMNSGEVLQNNAGSLGGVPLSWTNIQNKPESVTSVWSEAFSEDGTSEQLFSGTVRDKTLNYSVENAKYADQVTADYNWGFSSQNFNITISATDIDGNIYSNTVTVDGDQSQPREDTVKVTFQPSYIVTVEFSEDSSQSADPDLTITKNSPAVTRHRHRK